MSAMERCGASSLRTWGGGAAYFARGEACQSGDAHSCALEPGHSGPHAKRTLTPLSEALMMQTTYTWSDENALRAQVEYVSRAALSTPSPVDAREIEAIEQTISAWAFAHNIDGAARNDLFKRLRGDVA